MATFRQRESGYWQAIIRRKGQPDQSKSFRTKVDAEAWARSVENEFDRGVFVSRDKAERMTFKELAERFEKEVLPTKRGGDRDLYRLRRLVQEFGSYSLASISGAMVASYRDLRLKVLAPQSVVHELNLLARVFKAAAMDWGIPLVGGIPTTNVRKPAIHNERHRRLEADEETRLLNAIDQPGDAVGSRRNAWVKPIVVFAIETAARQSEILSLTWQDVDLKNRVARLRGIGGRATKNNDSFRNVPLSTRAINVLAGLPRKLRGPVFPCSPLALKQSWQRAVRRARLAYEKETLLSELANAGLPQAAAMAEIRKVLVLGGRKPEKPTPALPGTLKIVERLKDDPLLVDLHFHDLRHEATSRLAEKLREHELMKVTGHKGTKMLARYYHPRAEDLAKKLD